jgi:HPt (histidine-containing phosphotransfer) domain-containing protein
VLEQLTALQTREKPDLVAQVINLYLDESPKLIAKLKRAAGASDAAEIANAAHTLKSSSANLGATGLTRLCGDIEASARADVTEQASTLVAQVETEFCSVQAALAAELERLAA